MKMKPKILLKFLLVLSEKYGIKMTDLLKILISTDKSVGEKITKKYFFEMVDYAPLTHTAYDD